MTTTDTTATAVPTTSALECHIDRATLANALSTVSLALARHPDLPMARGVLLDGHDGDLTMTATDMETTASVRLPGTAPTSGRLLIDHSEATKMLTALVKGARKRDADTMPVTVRTADDGTAVVELGGYTIPVTTYPAADFPTLPDVPPTVAEVDREQLAADVARVRVATGSDDTLPALTGVHLHIAPGTLTLAGTDRYRLAVARLAATTPTEQRSALFPGRVLAAALKHAAADRVGLGLGHDRAGQWVSLACGELTVITRPAEADFPAYERLFPETPAVTARADRKTLAQATTRAAAAADAKKPSARNSDGRHGPLKAAVTVDPAGTVSVAPALGEHADVVTAPAQPAEVDGATEPLRVLFNATYLREALNTLDGETVTVQLTGPTRPVVFTGANDSAYRHLLMPIRPQHP